MRLVNILGSVIALSIGAFAAGCAPSAEPIPTLAALAPTIASRPTASVASTPAMVQVAPSTPTEVAMAPATYTPVPTATAVPSATATASCSRNGEVVGGEYPSMVDGPVRSYQLYLPPCYGGDGRVYPTLIMLHGLGADQDEYTWDALGVDEAADSAIRAGEIPPLLIVMPAGGWAAEFTSGGAGSFEAIVLEALIPHMISNSCAWSDPKGWAIGGLSRGGYWALEIAFRQADRFTSVGGHSAALLDIGAGPDLNPQYTVLTRALGNLRIYLDVGDEDAVMLPNLTRLHNDMTAASIPHEWHLNAGGHNAEYWSSQVGAYLAWYGDAWSPDRLSYPVCDQAAKP